MNIKLALKSCHRYADRRAAQNATWLQEWPHDFFYLIGQPTTPHLPDALHCNVSDAFKDIAPKVQYACRYALDTNTDFLVVGDDDTLLIPERLLACGFQKHDYLGFMRTSGLEYNANIPYAQGSCYVLSARAMEKVVLSDVMRPGIIDDGAVGQALFRRVPFTHEHRFEPGPVPEPFPMASNDLISTHKCLPDTMRNLWAQWRKR